MAKAIPIIFTFICIGIMALPFAAMPFSASGVDTEFREQASAPKLNGAFFEDFDAWLSDHHAFRAEMIRANALLNIRLLKTSSEASVIAGRGSMLFFEETVPDFLDAQPLSQDEAAIIGKNIGMLADSLAERGSRLFIAVAPNKNTLYPENMPAGYAHRQTGGNIPRLERIVRETDAFWIDLLTPLRAAKETSPIYYATDTHWNTHGAHAAAEAILAAMGREMPRDILTDTAIYSGDLARMLGLKDVLTEEAERLSVQGATDAPEYDEHEIDTAGQGEDSLLFLRDSFGGAIAPFIVYPYGEARLRWQVPLDGIEEADDVLVLIAERNIRMYLLEPPDIIAPAADAALPSARAACEIDVYQDGELVFVEFTFANGDGDGYVFVDGDARLAAPVLDEDGQPTAWQRAIFWAYELSPDTLMQPATRSVCADAVTLGEYVDLDADEVYDMQDDLQWLESLRALDEEEGSDGF